MTDYKKLKILRKLFLRLELRNKRGSGAKIITLLISYLIPGIFIPFLIYKQNADFSGFEFCFLTYLAYSIILSFTLISEFDNLLISKVESDVMNILPIDNNLLSRAKISVIFRYTLIVSLPLLLPGSFFYYLIMKSAAFVFLYFVNGVMLFLFIIYLLLLIYCLGLRYFGAKKIGTYSLIFQIFLIMFLIIGYQYITYTLTGWQGSNLSKYINQLYNENIIQLFPQQWFAFISSKQNLIVTHQIWLKILLPIIICYMSYLSFRFYFIDNYEILSERIEQSKFIPPSVANRKSGNSFLVRLISKTENTYLRNSDERASYFLLSKLLMRDKQVRLNVIPMIFIPVGLGLFALFTNQLPDPLSGNFLKLKPVFHISILLSILVVLNTSILGLKITNYSRAFWIYDAYPISYKNLFINGVRKFFIVYLILPISVILFILFSFSMNFVSALIHTVFIFLCADFYNSLFHLFNRELPFTKENTLFNSVSRLTSVFIPLLYGILCMIIQTIVYRNITEAALACVVFSVIIFAVNYFSFVRIPGKVKAVVNSAE